MLLPLKAVLPGGAACNATLCLHIVISQSNRNQPVEVTLWTFCLQTEPEFLVLHIGLVLKPPKSAVLTGAHICIRRPSIFLVAGLILEVAETSVHGLEKHGCTVRTQKTNDGRRVPQGLAGDE